MVVKKTVKKAAPARKISPVIVETKKHQDACCTSSHKKCFGILLIVLLLLNLIIGVLNYFRSNSAWDVEVMKVGGVENLELVKQLYEMDSYKAQQKGAIMQVLGSFDSVGTPEEAMMPQQLPIEEMPIE
ncbi:hypothetical protein K9M48_04075 [Candidatus Gracilibacteria bacterium]|nr:hypothetical protein [Candidatus Gracilibacteria bacterium]